MKRPIHTYQALSALALVLLVGCTTTISTQGEKEERRRWLHVRVYEQGSATPNVVVRIPTWSITPFMKMAAISEALGLPSQVRIEGFPNAGSRHLRISGAALAEIWDEILEAEPGPLIQIDDRGDRVEIWIE